MLRGPAPCDDTIDHATICDPHTFQGALAEPADRIARGPTGDGLRVTASSGRAEKQIGTRDGEGDVAGFPALICLQK